MQHFEQQQSQTPNVDFESLGLVVLVLHHFRGHVLEGSADARPSLVPFQFAGESEVTELHREVSVEENVLRLDVPVQHFVVVEVLHCSGYLVEEPQGQVLPQPVEVVDVQVHATVAPVLHHYVRFALVLE